jgi:hypothetical protein
MDNAKIIRTSDPRPFAGPVRGTDQNPMAHGNIQVTEYAEDGRHRNVNVNGCHREEGPWQ